MILEVRAEASYLTPQAVAPRGDTVRIRIALLLSTLLCFFPPAMAQLSINFGSPGVSIGVNRADDLDRGFTVTDSGITVVGKGQEVRP